MRLLDHANTKPCCEIQCEALEFSKQHQWLADLNEFKGRWNRTDKQEEHSVKAFQSTNPPSFTVVTRAVTGVDFYHRGHQISIQ